MEKYEDFELDLTNQGINSELTRSKAVKSVTVCGTLWTRNCSNNCSNNCNSKNCKTVNTCRTMNL